MSIRDKINREMMESTPTGEIKGLSEFFTSVTEQANTDFLKKPMRDLSEYSYQSGFEMGISAAKTFLLDKYTSNPDLSAFALVHMLITWNGYEITKPENNVSSQENV